MSMFWKRDHLTKITPIEGNPIILNQPMKL